MIRLRLHVIVHWIFMFLGHSNSSTFDYRVDFHRSTRAHAHIPTGDTLLYLSMNSFSVWVSMYLTFLQENFKPVAHRSASVEVFDEEDAQVVHPRPSYWGCQGTWSRRRDGCRGPWRVGPRIPSWERSSWSQSPIFVSSPVLLERIAKNRRPVWPKR